VSEEYTIVGAIGSRESLVKVGQLLAWLSAVFRVPEYRGLSYSRVTLQPAPFDSLVSTNTNVDIFQPEVVFDLRLAELRLAETQTGSCWRPMFSNSVIAEHFPVPRRGREVGLELLFAAMLMLGRISYLLEMPKGIILKGHSTMLIPISQPNPQSIQ
jgi:hypothetical protein